MQSLVARLGGVAHQDEARPSGEATYGIRTIANPQGVSVAQSPLIRAETWYFTLWPPGECLTGSLRLQLPDATVKLEPKRLIVNWADHGWGVDFPGARLYMEGLGAQSSFSVCLDGALRSASSPASANSWTKWST